MGMLIDISINTASEETGCVCKTNLRFMLDNVAECSRALLSPQLPYCRVFDMCSFGKQSRIPFPL